jgi:proliferating cell nuclear antigen
MKMKNEQSESLFEASSLKLRIKDSKQFKDTLSALATLIDDGTFRITDGGMILRGMDPSRVAMVDFEWTKAMFEELVCEKPHKISFNIGSLIKLTRNTGKDDQIELSVIAVGKTPKLQISIVSKQRKRDFTMPLLEASEEEVPTPKITFNTSVKLTVEGLQSVLEDAALVSDSVTIKADPEELVFSAEGDLLGATMTMPKASGALMDLNVKEPQRAVFSLSYIVDIVKAGKTVSDVAVLEFSTDMPLKLTFLQPQTEAAKLVYYVAPRIQPEQ